MSEPLLALFRFGLLTSFLRNVRLMPSISFRKLLANQFVG